MTLSFTRFVLSQASDNTPSRNIGGTDAWAIPHLKFFMVDRLKKSFGKLISKNKKLSGYGFFGPLSNPGPSLRPCPDQGLLYCAVMHKMCSYDELKCAVTKGCLCSDKKRSFGNLAGSIEISCKKGRSKIGNWSSAFAIEMCSDEFSLKHALVTTHPR